MEFLDPEYKKRHSRILVIGQGLIGLAVVTVSIFLVLKAYGFDVDRKTGEVIQSGLVYVDSAPDKAEIKINGSVHSDRTNTRFTLPAGNYNLQLNKSGYRTWQRQFELEGSSIERFNYPMLLPSELKTLPVDSNTTMGTLYSQSPDRKWIIVSDNPDLTSLKEYNLTDFTTNKLPKTRSFAVPAGVFEKDTVSNKFEVIDWSNNNAEFLVKHTFDGKIEHALINKDEPAKSFNLKTLGATEGEVTLLDKSADKFLVHNKTTGSLTRINKKDKKISQLLSGVLSFKSHGDDKVLFTRVSTKDPAKADVLLLDNDKTYNIREIPLSTNMPLDIAGFQDKWYLIVGSEKEARTYIYEDFVKKSKDSPAGKVGPIRVIKNSISSALAVGFSKNVQFVSSFGGNDVSVYDIEHKRSYRYKIDGIMPVGDMPVWMDGHRLVMSGSGQAMIVDFDGSNMQSLTPLPHSKNIFFDRDYENYYTVVSADQATFKLDQTALRTPADQ